ncbi:MAG: LuxR family transcriptional regulator [Alphaproteobacteria bacterium]|nr:LuxR family transcriptional regulator [Alphaproteobacteria bacterium]|tara:strand:- start:49 stop:855 length:807 start_codon:yes stop_codon:yes gene_type:complete
MLIDSHCHLNHIKIKDAGSPSELIKDAKSHGIAGLLTICCQINEEFDEIHSIAKEHENVWCSVGTHPHDAGLKTEMAISQSQIEDYVTDNPKVIGIGETGLDYYYDNSPREAQKESFRKHIRACLATDTPVIIHTRDAEEETIEILQEEGQGKLRGVLHCFSGSSWLAEKGLKLGLYISFSGIVTFKKATELQEIAKATPLERILVETDAPYLAPVPFRGKTNVPAYVRHTSKFLSELKSVSEETVSTHSTENFFKLFNKAKDTWITK